MPDLMTDWGEVESKLRAKGGNLYDPSDLEGIKRNTGYATGAVDLDTALNNAYANYDQRSSNTPGPSAPAASPYSSSTPGAAGAGDAALSSFLDYMKTRDAAAQQQQKALQDILMGHLGQLQQPVDQNAPGIKEVLEGSRLGLQRGAERQRKEAAELRAYDGSGGVGGKAFEGDVRRIQEGQAEADAQMTGNVLNRELQSKRDQLTRLLSIAAQLGDSESARTLQAQIRAIEDQLSQSNQYDNLAYQYSALNQSANANTLMSLLGVL